MAKQITGFRPGSKAFKNFMAKLYGIGASVVIIGALFKIQHYQGAGIMLICGLSTEAIIFFFSAFEPPHSDPDWTLVYPELATDEVEVADETKALTGSVTEQLDTMLEDAKIEPELIQNLGRGLQSLSSQANKLNEMTDAAVATNEYVSNLKGAAQKVGELSDNYAKASESIVGISAVSESGQEIGSNMAKMSSNLSALNNMYEMQLQSSQEHLESTRKLYEGISEMMTNLHDSLDDTKAYKEHMAELAKNLSALNTVYGNMLNVMSGPKA